MNNDDFLRTTISYGLIIRGDIEAIQALKEVIAANMGIKVVYQRFSDEKLYIHEKR
ncbi:MAG: hypothetical protein ACP5EQ_07745 [Candidatus Cloacimonadia bacterium]